MLIKIVRNPLSDKSDDYIFHASSGHNLAIDSKKEFGIYIHIPFCERRAPLGEQGEAGA